MIKCTPPTAIFLTTQYDQFFYGLICMTFIIILIVLNIFRYLLLILYQAFFRVMLADNNWIKITSRTHKVNNKQLKRENKYKEVFIQSSLALLLLSLVTNYCKYPFSSNLGNRVKQFYLLTFLIHILISEPLYYILHVLLHVNKTAYKKMHSFHHLSIHPEPLTGFVQDSFEHIIYSLLFVIPLGLPSIIMRLRSIPWHVYFVYIFLFDLFNVIGHVNIEFFPKRMGSFSLEANKKKFAPFLQSAKVDGHMLKFILHLHFKCRSNISFDKIISASDSLWIF